MPNKEELERYRRMTTSERLELTLKMSNDFMHCLFKGTPQQIERRFERMRQEKNDRNRLIREGIARSLKPKDE